MSEGARTPVLPGTPTKERFLGVDVARGVALISMLAANVFDDLDENGEPSLAVMTVTGRSATMFVMVAGISLAFITGGRYPVQGRDRRAVAVGIVVRALLIGAIGLALGYVAPDDFQVILPFYALFFLLAIPLVGLRPRTLALIAAGLVVIGPLLVLGAEFLGIDPVNEGGLTFNDAVTDPIGFLLQLFATGRFPAAVYMIYLLAGLAVGRLDLSSTMVAIRLLVGGLVLAVISWFTSSVILFNLGGLEHLIDAAGPDSDPAMARNEMLWDAPHVDSWWWWLAVRSHHAATPIGAAHSLGTALAVLGAVLLVVRLAAARRLLWPVGVAGAMTLTIYSTQVLIVGSGWLSTDPLALFLVTAVGAVVFAVILRRLAGQGPLERIVSMAAGRARRAAMGWRAGPANEMTRTVRSRAARGEVAEFVDGSASARTDRAGLRPEAPANHRDHLGRAQRARVG